MHEFFAPALLRYVLLFWVETQTVKDICDFLKTAAILQTPGVA